MAKQQLCRLTKLSEIRPYDRNPRIIPQAAVDAVAKSITAFGFRQPIVVDGDGVILAGHTRYKAAQRLGMTEVPVVWQTDITPIQARGYRIADNKTAEIAAWDRDALDAEVKEIAGQADADLDALGMSSWELDRILHECAADGPLEELQASAPADTRPRDTPGQTVDVDTATATGGGAYLNDDDPHDGSGGQACIPPGNAPRYYDKAIVLCYDAESAQGLAEVLGIRLADLCSRRTVNPEELSALRTRAEKKKCRLILRRPTTASV